MAWQDEIKLKDVLYVGLGIGALFLVGKFISGWQTTQETKKEIAESIKSEADAANAFIEARYADGTYNDPSVQSVINTESQNIENKVLAAEAISHGWTTDMRDIVVKAFGVAPYLVAAVAGYIVAKTIYNKFGQKGPPPGGWNCIIDGQKFYNLEQLRQHAEESTSTTTNTANIAMAQSLFQQEQPWIQEAIAAESGLYYTAVAADWRTLSSNDLNALGLAIVMIAAVVITKNPQAATLLLTVR